MNFVALKMLTGDRAKYLGLIFHDRILHVPARKPDVDLRRTAPVADKNGAQRQMQNLRRASSDKISCAGPHAHVCSRRADVSETTLYEWRGEYPELEPRLEAARERAREDALRVIQEAGKKDWRAKEAWLRLSFQADYRRDTSINVTATANAQQAIVVTEEKRRELQERLKPTKRIGG